MLFEVRKMNLIIIIIYYGKIVVLSRQTSNSIALNAHEIDTGNFNTSNTVYIIIG